MERTKFFIFKQDWLSICSRHQKYNSDCEACKVGYWSTRILHRIELLVHDNCYSLWYLWQNRRNSKINKFLRKKFPNIK